MIETGLLVFSHSEPFYCCAHLIDTIIACSTQKSLVFWDIGLGRPSKVISFDNPIDPVSLCVIKSDEKMTLMLQDKTTRVYTYHYDADKNYIETGKEYQLEPIGFTKLPFYFTQYDDAGKPTRTSNTHFPTIKGTSFVENRNIETGALQRSWKFEEANFTDLTFMLSFGIKEKNFLLVAQEGLSLKLLELPADAKETPVKELILPSNK